MQKPITTANIRELQENEEVREGDFWRWEMICEFKRFDKTPMERWWIFKRPRRYKKNHHAKTYRVTSIESHFI